MTFPPEVWSGVLRRLSQKLPAFTFEAWIAPLTLHDDGLDRVIVLCPTPFHRDRVRNSLREPITDAIRDELGRRSTIDFDVQDLPPDRAKIAMRGAGPGTAATTGEERRHDGVSMCEDAAQVPKGVANTSSPPRPRDGCDATATPRRFDRAATVARSASLASPMPGSRATTSIRHEGSNPGASAFNSTLTHALADTTSRLARAAGPRPVPDGDERAASGMAAAHAPSRGPSTGPSAAVRPAFTSPRALNSPRALASPAPRHGVERDVQQSELPYTFSFDNFVVGPCNALAREAAFAVTGAQQAALRQLYLASPAGLGKTHLARAVATEFARTSRRPLRYANAELFTSEFVSALRNKRTPEFKRRYRLERGGLLVLEDVQFLAAKRATQLEFFHSVQHVLDAGGRVLLTGDRMPQEMGDLDERLRAQLAGGFVAALEPPDAIVRRRILRMKAAHGAIALPEECLDLLVESVAGSVRELEGVLMQVVTTSTLLKRPIDLELTKRAIAQKVQPIGPRARRPQIADVLAVVATFFQTSADRLAARSRKRAVLVPRQLAMYLCHRHTDAPLAEIGRALGRDHPSVRNAIAKVEREMMENPKLRYQVEALTTRIQERIA